MLPEQSLQRQTHVMPATPDALPSTQLPVENLNQAFSGLADEAPALTRRQKFAETVHNIADRIWKHKRLIFASTLIAASSAVAACASHTEAPKAIATATPNVEKPRWQTDESYAIFLFLNQDHQSKLTDQEKADWKAMQEYNIYAGSNNQKPMFQSGQYQELPLEGMILSNNTHLSEDKKQIQGYITFGFIVEVNGTRVPQVVKFRLDSTDPWNNKVTNIQGVHKNSDWTNGPGYNSDVADGTIQGEFDWLQANVDHQVALGLTRIYDAKTGRDGGWTLPASIESYKMMKWIQNEGPKPAGILGPDATMDQIAAAPSVSFFCEDAGSL